MYFVSCVQYIVYNVYSSRIALPKSVWLTLSVYVYFCRVALPQRTTFMLRFTTHKRIHWKQCTVYTHKKKERKKERIAADVALMITSIVDGFKSSFCLQLIDPSKLNINGTAKDMKLNNKQ